MKIRFPIFRSEPECLQILLENLRVHKHQPVYLVNGTGLGSKLDERIAAHGVHLSPLVITYEYFTFLLDSRLNLAFFAHAFSP